MPEVNRSHRTASIWPWALGIFAVLAIGFVIVSFISTGDEVVENKGEGYEFESVPSDVNAFSDFLIMAKDSLGDGINSDYTKEGILHLSEALNALVKNKENISDDLRKKNYQLSKKAEDIAGEDEIDDMQEIKEVFIAATEIIDSLTNSAAIEIKNEVAEIQSTANQLNEDKDLFSQDEIVMNFFDKANSVIKSLANSETPEAASL